MTTLLQQPPAPAPALAPVSGNGSSSRPAYPPANILLVDDRPDKLLALESVLSSLGQKIHTARSGKEALRLLLKQDFAVILLDVSMPTMDGFETAALIRQRPRTEHTPIIFITSISQSENHISQGYSLGAVDYLLTPIIPDVLRGKVAVFVDLHNQTELIRQQSEQLADLNRSLQQRISALTAVNEELEAFNYSIAHDLRAPLRSMGGFANALVEDEATTLGATGRQYAERIVRSVSYMDKLLLDLLAYSQFSRAEMPSESVDLEALVKETLSLFEQEIEQQKVQVEVMSPLLSVHAHAPTLKQILANLIGNSLKFIAPDRPPTLRISTLRDLRFIRLSIEDNGIGINPRHHDKIFGLFERLHDAQAYPGTGVGLAIVRKGAHRMGGRVGVESQPGQGSRFWVDLPAYHSSGDVHSAILSPLSP